MREALNLLAQPVGVELFYSIHDPGVNVAAAFVEHSTICDVMREGVLKRVLQVRKEPCRVEKFSSLQIVEQTAKLALRQPTNCMQQCERYVMSDHRRLVHTSTGQRAHDLFGEERIAARALRKEVLHGRQTRVGAQ